MIMSNKEGDLSVNTIFENIQISRDTVAKVLNKITELQFEILNLQKDILQIQKIQEEQAALFSENEQLKQELRQQKVRIYGPPTPLFVKTGGGLKRPDDQNFNSTPDQQNESEDHPESLQEQNIQLPADHRARVASVKSPIAPAPELSKQEKV